MNFLKRSLPLLSLLIAIPAYAERTELKNPAWQEVPGTASNTSSSYVEVNGMTRKGDTLSYDVVNWDAGYSRVEMNCKAQQFRTVRMGYFESRSRINYKPVSDPWIKPETAYHKALAAFVCSLK
ncbi:MAG: hypothetical protein KME10_10135 [Plectolyngbya sp. WJT66-NPBG17]|jgi:hypothetical protein|nr:hypothetical protein [Plectolyngbya sp. WJT66-NPBG17]MBW4524831.1 hypothetical protein [Phormidium tanganyikae FI6-MK23]